MTDLEAAYRECHRITRREARNFYYASIFLPPKRRRAIYVAYAFCRYCDDAVDSESSTEEKLLRLSELRRMLEQCHQGQADDPVFLGLSQVVKDYAIPRENFEEILAGMEADLVKTRYQDFGELRQYCYQVASAVGLVCIQISGFKDARARAHAIDLGLAMQLTNISRDVKEDLDLGRIYLPRTNWPDSAIPRKTYCPVELTTLSGPSCASKAERARAYFRSGFRCCPTSAPGPGPVLR